MNPEISAKSEQLRRMREIRREVENVRLWDLDESCLRGMLTELDETEDEIVTEAERLRESLRQSILDGHGDRIPITKKLIRQQNRHYEEVAVERDRVFNALQERILRRRLLEKFGNERNLRIWDGLVISLIVLVIGLLTYEFSRPELATSTLNWIVAIDTGCCIVFLWDFFMRVRLADSKSWYWRRYWIDFVTSIPIPPAQIVRYGRLAKLLRLVRLARLARFLRMIRMLFFFWRGMDKLEDVFHLRLMKRSLFLGISILILGAMMMYWTEGGGGIDSSDQVDTVGDSVWWSFTTLVTGGYGDLHNPVTPVGRLLTVMIVIAGMVVVGIFTATLTSVLVGDESEEIEMLQHSMEERMESVESRLGGIEEQLQKLADGRDEGS
jgi:voltage-gated potassium channel